MPRFHRRRRFGRSTPTPVTSSTCVMKRKSKCRACNGILAKGDTATRLRLKKSYQQPCTACGHKPAKLKYFHTACVPSDINKAMGYDPAMHAGAPSAAASSAVPPPPKPKTSAELDLEAIASLEAALVCRSRGKMRLNPTTRKMELPPELEKAFKTVNGIKARVLRPGTPGEGEAATNVCIKKLVDLIFS